jgi:hypothetical protein
MTLEYPQSFFGAIATHGPPRTALRLLPRDYRTLRESVQFRFGVIALAIALAPIALLGGMIQGTTGESDTGWIKSPLDDKDFAATFKIEYRKLCPWIITGAEPFTDYRFVHARDHTPDEDAAKDIPNIDPSDFTINTYKPWVINNNDKDNSITGPDGSNYDNGVTGQDAGGVNIVISYTPQHAGDPTKVNFVQVPPLPTTTVPESLEQAKTSRAAPSD